MLTGKQYRTSKLIDQEIGLLKRVAVYHPKHTMSRARIHLG